MQNLRELIKSITLNHGFEVPFMPRWCEHRLYRVTEPLNGKRYYTEIGDLPSSQTWLSDEEAEEVIKNWEEKIDQMTAE